MTADRRRTLIEAYGADVRRWPAEARGLHRGADGELMSEAEAIDAWLDQSRPPVVSADLRARVIGSAAAAGLTPRRAQAAWRRLKVLVGAGWTAAALAGAAAGVGMTLHATADARVDAVFYQATLGGVDDTEVLG